MNPLSPGNPPYNFYSLKVWSYTIGVPWRDGKGPQQRGVTLVPPATAEVEGPFTKCDFTLKNTGTTLATDAARHPQDANAYLNCDIYRLSVSINAKGWSAQLQNELAAVKFGDAKTAPVYLRRSPGSAASATVTLKATSESDPTKTTTATFTVNNTK